MPSHIGILEMLRKLRWHQELPDADDAVRSFQDTYSTWAGRVFASRYRDHAYEAEDFRDWFCGWLVARGKFGSIYNAMAKVAEDSSCASATEIEYALKNYLARVIKVSAGPEFLKERKRTLKEGVDEHDLTVDKPVTSRFTDASILVHIREAIDALRLRPKVIYTLSFYLSLRDYPNVFQPLFLEVWSYCAKKTGRQPSEIEEEMEESSRDLTRMYVDRNRCAPRFRTAHIAKLAGEEKGKNWDQAFKRAVESVQKYLAQKGIVP